MDDDVVLGVEVVTVVVVNFVDAVVLDVVEEEEEDKMKGVVVEDKGDSVLSEALTNDGSLASDVMSKCNDKNL